MVAHSSQPSNAPTHSQIFTWAAKKLAVLLRSTPERAKVTTRLANRVAICLLCTVCGFLGFSLNIMMNKSLTLRKTIEVVFWDVINPYSMSALHFVVLAYLHKSMMKKARTGSRRGSAVSPMKTVTMGTIGTTNKPSGTSTGAWTGTVPTAGTVGSPVSSISSSAVSMPSNDARELS